MMDADWIFHRQLPHGILWWLHRTTFRNESLNWKSRIEKKNKQKSKIHLSFAHSNDALFFLLSIQLFQVYFSNEIKYFYHTVYVYGVLKWIAKLININIVNKRKCNKMCAFHTSWTNSSVNPKCHDKNRLSIQKFNFLIQNRRELWFLPQKKKLNAYGLF